MTNADEQNIKVICSYYLVNRYLKVSVVPSGRSSFRVVVKP
jgi:hypothetical protein